MTPKNLLQSSISTPSSTSQPFEWPSSSALKAMLSPPNEGGLSHKAISLTKLLQLPCDFEDFFGFFSSSFGVYTYIYIGKYTYSSLVISSESIASMTILSYDMIYIYDYICVYLEMYISCMFFLAYFAPLDDRFGPTELSNHLVEKRPPKRWTTRAISVVSVR